MKQEESNSCRRCGRPYSLRAGEEPTKYCDACAHEIAEHVTDRVLMNIGFTKNDPRPPTVIDSAIARLSLCKSQLNLREHRGILDAVQKERKPWETNRQAAERIVVDELKRLRNEVVESDKSRTDRQVINQTNELARILYRMRGYGVTAGHRFDLATHPQEREAWHAACEAQVLLTNTDPREADDEE